MAGRRRRAGMAVAAALLALPGLASADPSPDLVVSQVYGGGGNGGAPLQNDFIELFNRGATPVALGGRSVQYASATGTGSFSASVTALPAVTLQPGRYFLVQQSSGGAAGGPLPAPDASGSIAMSATGGKVALVDSATGLACNGSSTACTAAQRALIRDLVGYGTANFFEGSAAAPALSNTTAALRAGAGCTDTDQNGADLAAGAPAPRTTATPAAPCVAPGAAVVVTESGGTTEVAEGGATDTYTIALDRAPSGPVTVTATPDAQVTVSPASVTLTDAAPATITVAAVDDDDVEGPHTGTVRHAVTASADAAFSASTPVAPVAAAITDDENACDLPATPIGAVQGAGTATAGGEVTVQGVVVGDYEGTGSGSLRGLYVQDAGDGDGLSSDGIFVFTGGANLASAGDRVRVSGTAGEFQDQTQITSPAVTPCGTGGVPATDVSLPVPGPVAGVPYLERFEGMRVRFTQALAVTEHFQLGRFGQVVVSAGGRLPQPTNVVAPGAAAQALQAENARRRIIVDDALQTQNPDPIRFGRGGQPLSAANTLRGGDTVAGLTGVLTYTWAGNAASGNAYRVRPLGAIDEAVPDFQPSNPRPAAPPAVGGPARVASFNLLNWFNTFGAGNCATGAGGVPTDCRGADTAAELERQAQKTIPAILGLDADVIAVSELENDGHGPASAIQDLVDRLNAATAPGTYAFVDADAGTGQPDALGSDAIKVGILYRPERVAPVGTTAVLNTGAFGVFTTTGTPIQRSRPALAQAFEDSSGGGLVVVANHLKSKGSGCTDNVAPVPSDPDLGDGQGNCNLTRTAAARELAAWLAGDPTGTGDPDVLIAGDLNSYAKEDPVAALQAAGYQDLVARFGGAGAYSYVFDGQWGYLDHALASPSLAGQVTGAAEWHANADEPAVLDYNTNFKSAGQVASLFAPDAFRASDHDPLVVGLDLVAPAVEAGGPYAAAEGESVALEAAATGFGTRPVDYAWDLDGDGVFETPGRTPALPVADGPAELTVTARACGATGRCVTDRASVTVTDVAPAVTVLSLGGAAATACRAGTTVTLDLSFADPGADAPWSVAVDWGDGTTEVLPAPAAGAQATRSHVYPAGDYTVSVRVTDADGVASAAVTRPVLLRYAASAVGGAINPDGTSNFARASTIPLRLVVLDCTGARVTGLAPRVGLVRTGAASGRVNEASGVNLRPTAGVTMVWDRALGAYVYNLATARSPFGGGRPLAGGAYRLEITDPAVPARFPARAATFDLVPG